VLTDVLPYLRCPACHRSLSTAAAGRWLGCGAGHRFDVARSGYVNLAAGPVTHAGDPAAMVAARAEFLAGGRFDFISVRLAAAAPGRGGLVVDVGAGTGHHLAGVLRARPGAVGLAVDVSKPALRRAARAHPRAAAVLADAWRGLPVADGAATVALNVFAPRNGAEFRRVLDPRGALLVVTPTFRHLVELDRRLGEVDGLRLLRVDPDKPRRVAASLAPWFRPAGDAVHTRTVGLTRAEVRHLVEMGPSARHCHPAALAAAVAGLAEPVPVTVSVRIARYLPAAAG
jgi:23S rRNA (guanine745-N1)-methyltransferase